MPCRTLAISFTLALTTITIAQSTVPSAQRASTVPTTSPAANPDTLPATDAPTAIVRDRAISMFKLNMKEAIDALAAGNYPTAIAAATKAANAVNENIHAFSDVEHMGLTESAQSLIERAKAQEALHANAQAPNPSTTNPALTPLQKTATRLLADARKLWDAQEYDKAEILVREATLLDPHNANATMFLRLVDSKIIETASAPELERKSKVFAAEAGDRAAREFLEQTVETFIIDRTPLANALDALNDHLGGTMDINWPALAAAGVDGNVRVSGVFRGVSTRRVLITILNQIAPPGAPLSYTVFQGKIVISTRSDLESATYQADRTYDVRDMIPGGEKSAVDAVKNLINNIQSTVAPDSWKDAGGKIGTIRYADGKLQVHQTLDNLAAVDNLVEQLRERRGVDIVIETRVLLVSNNFLDDFRIGWDLALPSNLTVHAPLAAPAAGPVNESGIPASVIDNWTLSMLLQATQADPRTITITAKRLTIPNGDTDQLDTDKTSDSQPPPNSPRPTPEPAARPVRVTVVLTPTASGDRRNILLALGNIALNPTTTANTTEPAAKPSTAPAQTQPTQITIPDGGTLLINLGKIQIAPKDERTGLLLLRPKIVTHEEIEADLFGPGYDKPTGLPTTAPTTVPTTAPATSPATAPAAASDATKQKVAQLITDARKLYDAMEFADAQDLLKQASTLDPNDANATLFLRIVEFKLRDVQYKNLLFPDNPNILLRPWDVEHLPPTRI